MARKTCKPQTDTRTSVAIVGSGWAGYTLAHKLSAKHCNITVISPQSTRAYTPLLASAACGLFDFRLAEEPIRRKSLDINYIQASVTDVDFQHGILICEPAFTHLSNMAFRLSFDKIILAPGSKPNTFGTPGVAEHAFFVRNVNDAMAVRARIGELLETASLPSISETRQRALLHIALIGGGPTGIEMAAELSDLLDGDLGRLYPRLQDKFSITVHDVAPQILAPFEQRLSEYAAQSLKSHKVQLKLNSHITNVTANEIETKESGKIAYGMLIWATGNTHVPLIDKLSVLKTSSGMVRILTDDYLRILSSSGSPFENAYALGDAADIDGKSLPTTAEVACQKAEYMVRVLTLSNQESVLPFKYQQRAMVTYTGAKDGVIEGQHIQTGYAAWLAWRSGNLFWTRSWRRKIMMGLSWIMNWLDGREIARNY